MAIPFRMSLAEGMVVFLSYSVILNEVKNLCRLSADPSLRSG
jgi:hypothetical protein